MQFGVLGCGRIAQIMHIPNVAAFPETELHAIADPAENVLESVGDRYAVPHRYADPTELVADLGAELDAVIVTTPMHTHVDVAVPALEAGIDTLVEKPLAVTVEDADSLVEAADDADATAMVAYNKRYEPAYRLAKRELDRVEEVDLVTCLDIDPDYAHTVPTVYDLVDPELPDAFVEDSADERRRQVEEAIGTTDETLAWAYDFQLEHVCHDVNVLRGLFGRVEEIGHVDIFADGKYATAALEYEDGKRCILETGLSGRNFFEEYVRVDAPDRLLTLEFGHPMLRYNPATLRVKQGVEDLTDTVYTPTREEAFKRELEYFVDCVRGDADVRTTFAEARDDVALIVDLFETYRDE
ncbi:Gfo/Idh/MocA family protein [Halomicrococcus sp. NG-SE-24]|uniref:Gfo/Idh/MocA family protein n=1 Tax=Halomicrococcus sp. NG-SE-24 TaxID=3436928 RepID=UPI003D989936